MTISTDYAGRNDEKTHLWTPGDACLGTSPSHFAPHGTLQNALEADRDAQQELIGVSNHRTRVRNYLGYPVWLNPKSGREEHGSVETIRIETVSEQDLEELGAPINNWFETMPRTRNQTAMAH